VGSELIDTDDIARFGNISLVRMLLDEGADKSLVDLQGMTAKDHAKEKDCCTIIGERRRQSDPFVTTGMVDKSGNRKECSNRINC
jgi:hypothetical protein